MVSLKPVDVSEVTNEDPALINAAVASDDEVGEDDEPIESLRQLEGIVGPSATNLTAGDLFKALSMVLQEQKRSENRVLESMADMKSEILHHIAPAPSQNSPPLKKRAIGVVTIHEQLFRPFKYPRNPSNKKQ
ncbi:hypothetical protein BGZ59_011438 [Podila verticillata]|nr:hypothetical protein BGZ59_011438 [Podila verticillata]KFH74002.1 hypothetical protein MVEG_01215 [Podila verticillata NRRL 6337]